MTAKEADDLSKLSLRELLSAADRAAELASVMTASHDVLGSAIVETEEQND